MSGGRYLYACALPVGAVVRTHPISRLAFARRIGPAQWAEVHPRVRATATYLMGSYGDRAAVVLRHNGLDWIYPHRIL